MRCLAFSTCHLTFPRGLSTPFPPSDRKPSHLPPLSRLLPLSCFPPLSCLPALSSLLLSSTFLHPPEQIACLQSPPPTQHIHPRTTSREPLKPHFCRFPLGSPWAVALRILFVPSFLSLKGTDTVVSPAPGVLKGRWGGPHRALQQCLPHLGCCQIEFDGSEEDTWPDIWSRGVLLPWLCHTEPRRAPHLSRLLESEQVVT